MVSARDVFTYSRCPLSCSLLYSLPRKWVERKRAEKQYGFRKERSTDDALRVVHGHLMDACSARRVALAVSINICNSFNTVGWDSRTNFPPYLRQIPYSYLRERVWRWPRKNGDYGRHLRNPPGLRTRFSSLEHRVWCRVSSFASERSDQYWLCWRYDGLSGRWQMKWVYSHYRWIFHVGYVPQL